MKKPLHPLTAPPATQAALFTSVEAAAVQSLSKGEATADQQRTAWRWILEGACGLPIWPYRESTRETDIALGRHFVGQQLIGVTKVNISILKKREDSANG